MLCIILIAITIISIFGSLWIIDTSQKDSLVLFAICILFFGFLSAIVHMGIGISNLYSHSQQYIQLEQIKYEQLNNNKENNYLINNIIDWNQGVEYGKKYQHDFWIGPYIPNIYDNFEVIEMN